mgnify:CR=1 FL=1
MAKILIIEDNVTLSAILNIGLKKQGYSVEVAYDGIEGLKKAEDFKPDLIILDINLPKLSGFDVARIIKERDELKNTIIIMLTALSQDVNIQRGYSIGIDDYLIKPFGIEHLYLKLRKCLSES